MWCDSASNTHLRFNDEGNVKQTVSDGMARQGSGASVIEALARNVESTLAIVENRSSSITTELEGSFLPRFSGMGENADVIDVWTPQSEVDESIVKYWRNRYESTRSTCKDNEK